jgi:uncharacterized LabA/DUF88 family protein
MPEIRLKIAVFIDFDNIEIGVKNTLNAQFDIGVVLEALKERGDVVSKTAYGDWTRAGDYSRSLTQHATKLVQRNLTPGGDKNGADINLALDALEMAFTHPHINAYVIVGGDSDFISLVEKLKQYDKQIFVVGGRSFTSQVMQRNCHEFIAYENLIGGRSRGDRGGRGPSGPVMAQTPIDQAVPLLRRAIKVVIDREVSPQLGLLKSTMLQLDSTFSERTYGASTFRDFAEKLAAAGVVTLKEWGRNILVELKDDHQPSVTSVSAPVPNEEPRPQHQQPHHQAHQQQQPPPPASHQQPRAAEAVTEVRRLFQAAQQPPRWPMYVRQVKQYLRGVDASFDERKFGFHSLNDLLRACQKEGLFRMERDRQGVIRFFQGNVMKQDEAAAASGINRADIEAAERLAAQAEAELAAQEARESEVVDADVVREVEPPAIVDVEEAPVAIDEPAPLGEVAAERPRRKQTKRGSAAAEPRERSEPSKRRTRERAGESEGRSPSAEKERKSVARPKTSRKKVAVAADS